VENKKLFVLIPAFNAEKTIEAIIRRIPAELDAQVIVVDDGSSDDTAGAAARVEGVTVIRHEQNRGYGGAQATLYREAIDRGAEVAVMVHADGGHHPEELPEVLAPVLSGKAQICIGSRILGILDGVPPGFSVRAIRQAHGSPMPDHVFMANLFLSWVQNVCYRSKFASFHDGFRACTIEVLGEVPFEDLNRWYLYDTDFLVAAHDRSLTIDQVPVSTHYEPGASAMSRNLKYGYEIIKHALKHRFKRG
jgi:glycosyltransferase involved in cell wall biosynthesis